MFPCKVQRDAIASQIAAEHRIKAETNATSRA
jgi:hypothetical protein